MTELTCRSSAKARLVAAHKDVGAAVHQDDRVNAAKVLDQGRVRGAQRLDADAGERVDDRIEAVASSRSIAASEPGGQGPFREVIAGTV